MTLSSRRGLGAEAVEGKGHVAGTAAEVEDDGVWAGEDGAEGAGGATPPEAVDAGGEQVVEQVVARRNGVEHLLDALGRSGGVETPLGRAPGVGS